MGCCYGKPDVKTEVDVTDVDLTKFTFETTSKISLDGQYVKARVVDIYDGDTCTCVLSFLGNIHQFNIRLADIDACEMKSPNPKIKELANNAKTRLYQLITHDMDNSISKLSRAGLRNKLNENVFIVYLSCGKFEKYGRLLGWLYDSSCNIHQSVEHSYNHILIKEHLVCPYDGKTKFTEEQQIAFLVKQKRISK
jgi:endonuclease YncB( thermonuclease family)